VTAVVHSSGPGALPGSEGFSRLDVDGVDGLLRAIRIRASASNEPIVIGHVPAPLRILGSGTDAIAVQHPALPGLAFKVYAPQTVDCLFDEYCAYEQLVGSPYYAACLGRGDFYLVLSYEAGPTLYDCLVEGIPIPAAAMADVEIARDYARSVGLHPKDVHLKNIVLQGDRARILDVSKYVAPGDADRVWDTLAEGYRRFYPLIRGRRIPIWLIERVKRRYKTKIKGTVRQVPKPPSTAITWPVTYAASGLQR
jgi:hypothetical protein